MLEDIEKKELAISLLWIGIISFLLYGNYYLSKIICNVIDMPFDLTLTIVSPGFGLDLVIVLTVIESILLFIIYKFVKNLYKSCLKNTK